MSARRAPIALRMPISRVRSVTETSMMFITPIPPTSSEIAATAPSSVVKTSVAGVGGLADRALVDDLKARVRRVLDVLALGQDRGHLGLRGVERARR